MSKSVGMTAIHTSINRRYAENKRGFEFGSWTLALVRSISATLKRFLGLVFQLFGYGS